MVLHDIPILKNYCQMFGVLPSKMLLGKLLSLSHGVAENILVLKKYLLQFCLQLVKLKKERKDLSIPSQSETYGVPITATC